MSRVTLRAFIVAVLVLFGPAAGLAQADVTDSEASNLQEGDNSSDADLGGSSGSGDAVGGQVTGIVSSGDASVDAKNRSEDADVESGDTHGANSASSFVGHNTS